MAGKSRESWATEMWVYMRSEPGLFTTGYYDPKGVWHHDMDFDSKDKATERIH